MKHGEAPLAEGAFEAVKKGKESILHRLQGDEVYRESQLKIDWTESYGRYLDAISKIDISYTATYQERLRYEIYSP